MQARAVCEFPFEAQEDDELSLEAGDEVDVVEVVDAEWLRVRHRSIDTECQRERESDRERERHRDRETERQRRKETHGDRNKW